MTYRQIETSREVRLWIGQILVPAVTIVIATPEGREYVKTKYKKAKNAIKEKLSKG